MAVLLAEKRGGVYFIVLVLMFYSISGEISVTWWVLGGSFD